MTRNSSLFINNNNKTNFSSVKEGLKLADKMHVVANRLQLTLAILKPDCMACPHIVSEIRRLIINNGFLFVQTKIVKLSRPEAEEFYRIHQGKYNHILLRFADHFDHHRSRQAREIKQTFLEIKNEKFFYNRLVTFMCSGPIGVHVLARDDAINTWRKLLGPTRVLRTIFEEPDSIRGRFGLTDTRNCAHGSDSEETAKQEINFFFPNLNIEKWKEEVGQFLKENGNVVYDEKLCEHIPQR